MNKWKLITYEYSNNVRYKHTIHHFKTLNDVWNWLGFKLKRERNGYSGMIGNKEYTLTRIL